MIDYDSLSARKKKILFVIAKMGYGGAEKVLAFLASKLTYCGYSVFLLTYENKIVVSSLDSAVQHVEFPYSKSRIFGFRRILQILQARKTIREIMPDIVISFLTYPNMISIIASLGSGIPVIISERGDPYALKSSFTALRDFVYNYADGYVFQINGAKNYYNKKIQEKAMVIPNPINSEDIPAKWSGAREELIVNVARFEIKQKRQDILIEAFSSIARKYPNLKLLLYGDGQDEQAIRQIIEKFSLGERVILAGVVKNVQDVIKKARLFVLSSDYEGLPNALIEAMTIGLPCVSTNCSPGGAAELLKHMENGLIVDVGSVEALSKAIEYMLDNPDEAERMGRNAMRVVYDLDPEVIIGEWDRFIQKIILNRQTN